MKSLPEHEITALLEKHPHWTRKGSEITRTWKFSTFAEAIGFVNRVATHADEADHHPDILVQYNKVTLSLWTHDAGGLTRRDFDFADFTDAE